MTATAKPARRALLIAFAALIAVFAAMSLIEHASAEGGVPIPAPAGTEWTIVAGYNTGTHSEVDGNDPHAIDLVRVPRDETAFTPVLAPISGTIAWRGWDGLSITDSAGFDHVLAHVAPLEHIWRGAVVEVGEQVATVCMAHDCSNYGLPHIHYAVHQSRGDGYLGSSVPFTGKYAIEGRELHWSSEYNLHSGLEFTSTNTQGWAAPTIIPTADDPPDPPSAEDDNDPEPTPTDTEQVTVPEPEPEPVWTIPADAPIGGWRTIGVQQNTSVAGLFANLDAPLTELAVHHAGRQTYERFDPNDPESADVAVRSIKAGQAVWALVQPDVAWLPAPPPRPRQVTLRLTTGANLVSWQGPERYVAEALKNVAHLSHAHHFDAYSQTWRFWSLDGPDFLNTLTTLQSGDALYIVVNVGSVWTQLP
ncbi:MAG: hypothetical protein OXD50_06545 [Chloroflexi bacterium]|nr:hypothetical protein [Chloroflexota bacterium]